MRPGQMGVDSIPVPMDRQRASTVTPVPEQSHLNGISPAKGSRVHRACRALTVRSAGHLTAGGREKNWAVMCLFISFLTSVSGIIGVDSRLAEFRRQGRPQQGLDLRRVFGRSALNIRLDSRSPAVCNTRWSLFLPAGLPDGFCHGRPPRAAEAQPERTVRRLPAPSWRCTR